MLKHNLPILLPLALLTMLAAGVRGLALSDSLWVDELHTSWVVTDSLGEVGPRARLGNQQPLYFYLPYTAIHLLGEQEWVLRLPSYLAGIALIPAMFWLARRWTGSTLAALTVAALALLDRQWLFYAQEARVYAIAQLAAVGYFASLGVLLQRPSWRVRLIHGLLAVGMFYLHYTTALLVLAGWVALGVIQLGSRVAAARGSGKRGEGREEEVKYGWRKVVVDGGSYALLICPALPHVIEVARRRENWEQFVKQPGLAELLFVFPLDVYLLVPLLLTGLLAGGHWLLWRKQGKATETERPSEAHWLLAACWLLVPLLVAWFTTSTELARLYFPRYLMGASAGALLIAACCIACQRTAIARTVLALSIIYLAAWRGGWLWPDVYTTELYSHTSEQWREAIDQIVDHSPEHDLVLLDAGFIETRQWLTSEHSRRQAYCTLPMRGMYRLPEESVVLMPYSRETSLVSEQAMQLIVPQQRIWLLVRGRAEGAEASHLTIRTASGEHRQLRVLEAKKYGSVWLIQVRL